MFLKHLIVSLFVIVLNTVVVNTRYFIINGGWNNGAVVDPRTPADIMVDVTNNIGLQVLECHNINNHNNIAFSPYGLTSVLIALQEGVSGEAALQIHRTARFPFDRDVIRVGFRDIHRLLRSYFVPKEGFLAGLSLNNDNITLTSGYKSILQFYGYDLQPNMTTSTALPPEITTVVSTVLAGSEAPTSSPEIPTTTLQSETPEIMTTVTNETPETTTVNSEMTSMSPETTTEAEKAGETTESVATTMMPIMSTMSAMTSGETTVVEETTPAMTSPPTTQAVETTTTSKPETTTSERPEPETTTTQMPETTTTQMPEPETTTTQMPEPETTTTQMPEPETTTTQTPETTTTQKPEPETTMAEVPQTEAETTTPKSETTTTEEPKLETTTASEAPAEATTTTTEAPIPDMTPEMTTAPTTVPEMTSETATMPVAKVDETTMAMTMTPEAPTENSEEPAVENNSPETLEFTDTNTDETASASVSSESSNELETLSIEEMTTVGTSTTDSEELITTTNSMETTETESPRRKRSLADYLIARQYDGQNYFTFQEPVMTSIPPRQENNRQHPFLVNGIKEQYNIKYTEYDTVLPFTYLPLLRSLALKFPLDSDKYYLLIVLPLNPQGVNTLICDIRKYDSLRNIVRNLKDTYVRAIIPSFMLKGFVFLTNTLQRLGIHNIFEPGHADFSLMTENENIYVTNIEQAVTVTIRNYMESKIKKRRYYNYRPVEFKVTHPFIYFIMDSTLDVALMTGKVVNPLNSRIQ